MEYGKGPGADAVAPTGSSGGIMKAVLAIVLIVVLVPVAFFGCAFLKRNEIIELNQKAHVAAGNVESNYQRRLDLIPNLVSTVEGATKYEAATLKSVVESRNILLGVAKELKEAKYDPADPGSLERKDRLAADLLVSVRAYAGVASEAYPNLKASDTFRDLMSQIEGTENRINVARKDFNEAVGAYNAMILKWGFLPFCRGYKEREMFKSAPNAKEAPKVGF